MRIYKEQIIRLIDFYFNPDSKKYPSLANIGYPTYHTAYETFTLFNKIVDPDYNFMATSAMISMYLARSFADSLVLDYNLNGYDQVRRLKYFSVYSISFFSSSLFTKAVF